MPNINTPSDHEIRDGLLSQDEKIVNFVFYDENGYRNLILYYIRKVYNYEVDYDECANMLYLHLLEDDGRRLKQFQGRSSLKTWLCTITQRLFIKKRKEVIEKSRPEALTDKTANVTITTENQTTAKIDVDAILKKMPNQRYAFVIKKLILEDREPAEVAQTLGVTVDNLYNIKKRAMKAFFTIATK